MSAGARLAGFGAALVVLLAAGALAGTVLDPHPDAAAEPEGHGGEAVTAHGAHGGAGHAPAAVRGLAVAADGLRLVVEQPELRRGRTETLRFRIVDDHGSAVRDFDVEHARRMHLIVVRRDLTGFQHLHPTMGADGTWSTPLRLTDAGSYRLFADFSHAGEPRTLASDLRVDGDADLRPLPAPRPTAVSDGGHEVRLAASDVRAGREGELRFGVSRDGRPVRTEPYLGAGGHLVALRDGDLAFLHVHPDDQGREDGIGFMATFPTAGRYRLFLQFQVDGRVETVAFTLEVR